MESLEPGIIFFSRALIYIVFTYGMGLFLKKSVFDVINTSVYSQHSDMIKANHSQEVITKLLSVFAIFLILVGWFFSVEDILANTLIDVSVSNEFFIFWILMLLGQIVYNGNTLLRILSKASIKKEKHKKFILQHPYLVGVLIMAKTMIACMMLLALLNYKVNTSSMEQIELIWKILINIQFYLILIGGIVESYGISLYENGLVTYSFPLYNKGTCSKDDIISTPNEKKVDIWIDGEQKFSIYAQDKVKDYVVSSINTTQ